MNELSEAQQNEQFWLNAGFKKSQLTTKDRTPVKPHLLAWAQDKVENAAPADAVEQLKAAYQSRDVAIEQRRGAEQAAQEKDGLLVGLQQNLDDVNKAIAAKDQAIEDLTSARNRAEAEVLIAKENWDGMPPAVRNSIAIPAALFGLLVGVLLGWVLL